MAELLQVEEQPDEKVKGYYLLNSRVMNHDSKAYIPHSPPAGAVVLLSSRYNF